ncbi:unnamed protein product [Prorocentrum cordatum]|uniref:Uncharacterized protein n=1 Tax=Prorocentrum cordatum TaxID=2364126 RepID=A0ABN9SHV5_9DINO|nr:unnamed protein product [Polarella glacialis]
MGLPASGPRSGTRPPAFAAVVASLLCAEWAPAEATRVGRSGPPAQVSRQHRLDPSGALPDLRAVGDSLGLSATAGAPHWRAPRASGSLALARTGGARAMVARGARAPSADAGGTSCRCVCGHTVVWHREIFRGNVVREKEYECEEEVCPAVSIPGLVATGECTYVEDIQELTAGTVCLCVCGGRVAWRGRAFYGNVTSERERECLEEVCPVVNPIPGLQFEAKCRFVKNLFMESDARSTSSQPPPTSPDSPAKSAALVAGRAGVCLAAAGLLPGLA